MEQNNSHKIKQSSVKKDNELASKRHFVDIFYKDREDKVKNIVIPLSEDEYKENLSYRENIEEIVAIMQEEGGFWLDDLTIMPFHRVVMIKCYMPKRKRSRRSKPKTSKNDVKNENIRRSSN